VTEKALRPSPIGTWKVLSFQIEFEDSDERHEPYGKNPRGHVVITEERLIAVITGPKRATDATAQELFDSMMAYSGRYRMLGDDCFVTTVDSAWQPAWLGTDQVRLFNIDGEMLSVMGLFREDRRYPGRRVRGVLTGRKD
jgi:hypothetical protein